MLQLQAFRHFTPFFACLRFLVKGFVFARPCVRTGDETGSTSQMDTQAMARQFSAFLNTPEAQKLLGAALQRAAEQRDGNHEL